MKKKMAAVFLAGILTSSFLLTGCGNSTADNSSASSSSSASERRQYDEKDHDDSGGACAAAVRRVCGGKRPACAHSAKGRNRCGDGGRVGTVDVSR